MKRNYIFNLNRFGRYAKSSIALSYKQTLLIWATLAISIFIISSISMSGTGDWNFNTGFGIFGFAYGIIGFIYVGLAFSQFRNKEKTLMALMIPVTTFERFTFEILEKIILFFILFPILYYLFSNLAVSVNNSFIPSTITNAPALDITSFPYKPFSFQQSIAKLERGLFGMLIMLGVFLYSIAFAGAATFRKYPHIKTIVFIGPILAVIVGYMAVLEKLRLLKQAWPAYLEHKVTAQQGFQIGTITFTILSIISLLYAYYKLKEKVVK